MSLKPQAHRKFSEMGVATIPVALKEEEMKVECSSGR